MDFARVVVVAAGTVMGSGRRKGRQQRTQTPVSWASPNVFHRSDCRRVPTDGSKIGIRQAATGGPPNGYHARWWLNKPQCRR